MTDKTRIKIAAIVTALFLAAISIVGLAARSDDPQMTAPSAAAPAAVQPSTTVATGVASSGRSSTYEEEGDDEFDSSIDEREGYGAERYEEREDDD